MTRITTKKTSKSQSTLPKVLPYILIIGGIIGFLCAAIIMYEEVHLLKNPHYVPSCDLNPVISCGSVMQSKQAAVFGFPNPFIGLGTFPILLCIGMAIKAGARFKRWFWLGLEAGTIFGIGFIHWLFFETVYRIHALCPYCMVVWIITITTFWYVTLYNIDQNHIRLPASDRWRLGYTWVRRHHLDLLILWFLIIAILILKHFWYYYGHYF